MLNWQIISFFLYSLNNLYTVFIMMILMTQQLRADSEPVKLDFNRLVTQLIDIEKCGDALSNNKFFSSMKALKTEFKGSRNSERKVKRTKKSFSTFTKNLNGAKCSVCNSQ